MILPTAKFIMLQVCPSPCSALKITHYIAVQESNSHFINLPMKSFKLELTFTDQVRYQDKNRLVTCSLH